MGRRVAIAQICDTFVYIERRNYECSFHQKLVILLKAKTFVALRKYGVCCAHFWKAASIQKFGMGAPWNFRLTKNITGVLRLPCSPTKKQWLSFGDIWGCRSRTNSIVMLSLRSNGITTHKTKTIIPARHPNSTTDKKNETYLKWICIWI